MNDEQLAAVSDECYFDWWRIWVSSIEGADVFERDGVLIARSGAPEEWWNIVFIMRKLDAPHDAIASAVRYFDDHGQPFIVRIRGGIDPEAERVCESMGISYADTIPGMTLYPLPETPEPSPDLDIRPVDDRQSLDDLIAITAEAYGLTEEGLRRTVPLRLMHDDRWHSYVGYIDGEPATSATLQLTGEIAGVSFVGTRDDYRRRGLGEAMTWHAVREGAKRGCTIAALQASEMGLPIYERMGFRVVAGYRTFVRKRKLGFLR